MLDALEIRISMKASLLLNCVGMGGSLKLYFLLKCKHANKSTDQFQNEQESCNVPNLVFVRALVKFVLAVARLLVPDQLGS